MGEVEGESAFGDIARGDLSDTGMWRQGHESRWVRVIGVTHIIWEAAGHHGHKRQIYTEDVGNEINRGPFPAGETL